MARVRLTLEPLEERQVLTTYGIPWRNPGHLTLSFAPDGTVIAGHTSNLFETLNATQPTDVWQAQILRAFQTWAIHGNLNIAVQQDGGQPFGTPGYPQGDPRFGDIRIGAQPMAEDALGAAAPFDPFLAGTLTGDVFFNSHVSFHAGNLLPIALHEAGHVFGLEHSGDPRSPMYSELNRWTRLTQNDIAILQSLYGARAPDEHEGATGNDSFDTATPLANQDQDGSTPLVLFGDITTPEDVDFVSFQSLADYQGPVTFRLQTTGVSLLAPRLTVYDAQGRVLGTASSTAATGSTVTVTLPRVEPSTVYYASAEAAVGDLFGVGGYGLAVTYDERTTVQPAQLDAFLRGPYATLPDDDLADLLHDPRHLFRPSWHHSHATPSTSVHLNSQRGYRTDTHYEVLASIGDPQDVDYFQVRSPRTGTPVLTVRLWTLGRDDMPFQVTAFDHNHRQLPTDVLLNGNGSYTIQVPNVRGNDQLYLRVTAAPRAEEPVGNYALVVDFGGDRTNLDTHIDGLLDVGDDGAAYALYIARSQLFQFVFNADSLGAPTDGGVRLTIYNQDGNAVFSLFARAGETVSGPALFLTPGAYSAWVAPEGGSEGGELPPLAYRLRGTNLTDPIGPAIEDPTLTPLYGTAEDPWLYRYPGDFLSRNPFLWVAL